MVIKTVTEDEMFIPKRAHSDDAGFDLRCVEDFTIEAGGTVVMPAGINIEIPDGYFGKIESRSGLFIKGILAQGVIDAGFRGPVKVIMWNLSKNDISFKRGDRIAQMIIQPLADKIIMFKKADELSVSTRGENGYGSTGVK